jgi:hypothetical protein
MSLEALVSKYIDSATHVFETMETIKEQVILYGDNVKKVVESARSYLEDAEYFRDAGKLEVSLTSIAYCEGLLDALRLLGAVRFEWPSRAEVKRKK